MAWNGAEGFKKQLGGKGDIVPCMEKMFGIEGCPHCKRAAAFFEADKEKEGRQAYWKRVPYSYVKVISAPSAPEKAGKFKLMLWPLKPVEKILKKVQHKDLDLRWPTPTDLESGGIITLSKQKGDQYPFYEADHIAQHHPIDPAMWAKVGPRLADLSNPIELVNAVMKMAPEHMFSPREDMKEGETAKFRILPIYGKEDTVPFGVLFTHYVKAKTPWDKAWVEVDFDPERADEVKGMLGEDVNDDLPFDPDSGGSAPGAEDLGW